jgi:hypothetical protein
MPVWTDQKSRKQVVRFVDSRTGQCGGSISGRSFGTKSEGTQMEKTTVWNQQRMNELFETVDLLVHENAELRAKAA